MCVVSGMDRLAKHLEELGIAQRAFAARVGCSPSHLSDILSGRRAPGLSLAVAIQRETNGAVPVDAWIEDAA